MSAAGRAARAAIRSADWILSAPLALLTWPFRAAWRALEPRLARGLGPLLDGVPAAAAESLRAWRRRLLSPRFVPDVSAAPDPLEPAPRVLAGAVAAAARRCAAEGRPVRLLLARAPGAAFEVRLDAARRRCFVDRTDSADAVAGSAPRHAEAALPEFTPGAEPAVFRLAGGTDDVRLEWLPAGARGVSYRAR